MCIYVYMCVYVCMCCPVMQRGAADVSHHALCAVLLRFASLLRMAGP